jgi:hypothetical protein
MKMNKRFLFKLLGSITAMFVIPGQAFAGTMLLDSFVDQTPATINLPATNLLMATLNTSADKGGDDATATAVNIGGTVAASDVSEVCVDYATVQVSCTTIAGSLTNISITLGGNQKGGDPFDYRVTLNPSAGGKTIQLTVVSMSAATATGTPGVSLPQSTVTPSISAASTPPAIDTPTFTSVLTNGATLSGNITDLGTSPVANQHGTVWNYTGNPTTADNASLLGTPSLNTFTDARTGMQTADQVFFKAYVEQSGTPYYTVDSSFFTYPANDPSGLNFSGTDHANITINWTNSSETGDAGGSIVVVSEVDSSFTAPSDGTDYTPDASYPFSTATLGGNDYVVYKGTGTSVTITGLPEETQFWVAIYSASGLGNSGVSGVRYKSPTAATGTQTTNTAPATPTVDSPTFNTVTSSSAILGGRVVSVGSPAADQQGTVWNHTGGLPTENLAYEGGTPADTTTFEHLRDTPAMNSADQVFFRAFAEQSSVQYYSGVVSFYTYPANDPTGLNFTGTDHANITINWTNSTETGDAAGTIVVVSTADDGFTAPVDGTDYTPNAVYPFTSLGGNDYVVYKGTGNSVTISNLPELTTFYVAIYSASGLGSSGVSGVRYKTPTAATGNETTTAAPVVPTVDSPTFNTVTSSSAILGGRVVSVGSPAADQQGTVWNHTGGLPTENLAYEGGTPADTTTFEHLRDTPAMNSADQVFFRAFAEQSAVQYYSGVASFYTYPANDPTGFSIDPPASTSLTINWTNSSETGDAGGSIVVVSEVDATITEPSDGVDYSPDATYPFSTATGGGDDYVVYKGTGTSVTITNLPEQTQFWVAVYSYSGTGSGAPGVRYKTPTAVTGTETTVSGTAEPSIDTPTFSSVTATSAILGGHVVSAGTGPAADAQGTVWNHTGGLPTENLAYEGSTPADGTAFTHLRDTPAMNSADQVFFRAFVEQSSTQYYSDVASFYTYPTNDPTGFSIDPPGPFSLTINWTNSAETGDAGGSIVVVSEVDSSITAPTDGTDYTPDASYPFSTATGGGNDYVVYKGTGTSVTITNLPEQTQFWVAVYSASGLGNSGASGVRYKTPTATTGTETTARNWSQATNQWTHNISSSSMTLYWTAGLGDGSIVVMKEGGAVDSFPVDGTAHAADSIFGTAGTELTDPNPGNFVVYRGNGTSVHVTGLTQGLTYHMAVFTYTEAPIEYLLADPAITSETTTDYTPHNVAILNVDDTIGCTESCHGKHGSTLVPRNAEQEAICVSCHNPDTGFGGAKLLANNFSLHTNSKNSPVGSPGIVDCGSCHELHNAGTDSPLYTLHPDTLEWNFNLYYFRADKQYVPGALPDVDAVLHNNVASADFAFENGASYEGPCQICHTLTPTGYAQSAALGDDTHQGGDLGNVDCKECHDHGSNFAGEGGDCTVCHASEKGSDVGPPANRRKRRIVTTEFSGGSIISSHLQGTLNADDCIVCHNHTSGTAHKLGKVNLYNADTGAAIELTEYANPATEDVAADRAALTTFCLACHDSNGATATFNPDDVTNPNASALRPFSTTVTTDVVNIATDASNRAHTNGSASCFGDGNFGCHGSGHGGLKLALKTPTDVGPGASPDFTNENETFCLNCHDGGTPVLTPAAPNILADLGGSFAVSVNKHVAASEAPVNQNHDILPADKDWNFAFSDSKAPIRPQLTCSDCHLPPHDSVATDPVIKDPDSNVAFTRIYSTTASYSGGEDNWAYGGGGDPLNPVGCDPNAPGNESQSAQDWIAANCETVPGRTEIDYVDFCLTCHDGDVPAGVVMSHGILDIAANYNAEYHGAGIQSKYGADTNRGGMKRPWVTEADFNAGYDPPAKHAPLQCTTCHGPHGSPNVYNLRESINVAGVQMQVGGEGSGFSGISGTTYSLPTQSVPRYWGAWCTFCHRLGGHSYGEGQQCRTGHMHGGDNF